MTDVLDQKPADGTARATLLLAHGAGAGMDSAAMTAIAAALAAEGIATRRFEFPYMAERREGRRRPPPKAEGLVGAYRSALEGLLAESRGPVLIGGKSMGGRVATMLAAEPLDPRVLGVAVYGYPFRPPGKPDQLRLAPLAAARLPVLILQGTRDPFGGPDDVAGFDLPETVRVSWFEDGDHDLAARKASGHSQAGHLAAAAAAVRGFADGLTTAG